MKKGKAIYNPAGKAAEYSEWACNFYLKDSILKGAGYKRWDNYTNSEGYEVGRDYNIFKMLDIIGYSRTPKLGID